MGVEMEVVEPLRWVLKTWLARALLPKQVNSIEPKGLQSKRIQVIPDDYGGPLEKGLSTRNDAASLLLLQLLQHHFDHFYAIGLSVCDISCILFIIRSTDVLLES